MVACLSSSGNRAAKNTDAVHHPVCVRPQNSPSPRKWGLGGKPSSSKSLRFPRNIISEWRIASRVRVSPARSVGLGWSSDSHLRPGWLLKNSWRVARRRSVGRNLSLRRVRREFSSCLCRCSSGAISTVQNCAEARLGTTFKIIRPLVRPSLNQHGRILPLWQMQLEQGSEMGTHAEQPRCRAPASREGRWPS